VITGCEILSPKHAVDHDSNAHARPDKLYAKTSCSDDSYFNFFATIATILLCNNELMSH
jgi:hypothetical protein